MTSIALATCSALPDGDPDDSALPALLDAEFRIWDDPRVDWDDYDLVVVRSTWDYQRRRDEFLRWADGIGTRLVNPPHVLRWNTDKRYLADLRDAGMPVVPTSFAEPGEHIALPDAEHVVKPTVSAGSRDTARFGTEETERSLALARDIHASGRTVMIQPYLRSVDERGETAVIFFGGTLSHAIRKGPILRPGAEPVTDVLFAEEEIQPRVASAAERDAASEVVAWCAARFEGPLAYARVDLVEDERGSPQVLELELTEPSLFFEHEPGAAGRFAAAVRERVHR
jgi:glutathione synthase/RimK-type ligase-like ATP-grasp enzyme